MPSPTALKYFLNPFAKDAVDPNDITPIANTGSYSGIVSYEYGWTPPYELPSIDPSSLPVPRQEMNQLMFDITTALQLLQTQGYPLWISTADGGPANYPRNATLGYNTGSPNYVQIFQSMIALNASIPGANADWLLISENTQGVQTGTIIDFAGVTPPTGYLLCDQNPISRVTYARLFAVIGSTWGNGDGVTTFNKPDLRRHTTMGSGGTPGSIGIVTGDEGGAETVTLAIGEIPSHTHSYNQTSQAGFGFGFAQGTLRTVTSVETGSKGGGGGHNNMQPTKVVTKCIKF